MPNNVGGSLGGSSLVLDTSQGSFDVRVESDVIGLLRLIHINAINPDLKNHLRDLVFAYRQNPNETLFTELHTAFVPLGVTLVGDTVVSSQSVKLEVKQNVSSAKNKSTIGIVRPVPRFTFTPSTPVVKTRVIPVVQVLQNAVQATPSLEKKVSVASVTTPTPAPVVEVPKYVDQAEINYIERIKQIKKEVNEKVGNPVNLIDAHNEVGREYMNALLDAMKKSNGGQLEEIQNAMQRLEVAFVAVQNIIEGRSDTSVLSEPLVSPSSETSHITKQEELAAVRADAGEEVLSHVGQSVPITKNPLPEDLNTPIHHVAVPTMPSVKEALSNVQIQSEQNGAELAHSVHSVAKEKQLQDLMRATREKEAQTHAEKEAIKIASMDPLQTPEVTAGLGQLLSEWNLFKSSGLFGTGPSGKDHVLYTKLAPLTMAAVIAGRFEGVTPKIKQSITDYMNGWRYEEGIVHEHGETFEHYLRRVIFHILEKQKKK